MNRLNTLLRHASLEQLQADYWLARCPDADTPIIADDQRETFNAAVYERLGMSTVFTLAAHHTLDAIREKMQIPLEHLSDYYDAAGVQHPASDAQAYLKNHHATKTNMYGLIAHRTSLRTVPTDAVVTDTPGDFHFDLFQETTLDVGTPIVALAISGDARWLFALTPHYWGWLPAEDLMPMARQTAWEYAAHPNRGVVMNSHALIATDEGTVVAQMGTRLPIKDQSDTMTQVFLPDKRIGGIQNDGSFQADLLACTPRNVLDRAFSMLGERYAWGGYPTQIWGRDCSRFVKDVYATTGIQLPRNADEQEQACQCIIDFNGVPVEERKKQIIDAGQVGDLLVTPTHIMLYLGVDEGEPYVIHSAGGKDMQVLVSTLDYGHLDGRPIQVERLTGLVRVG